MDEISTPLPQLSLKEEFLKFFQDPSRDQLREILRQHLGESKNLDFKETWPDFPKLAISLLAFANTNPGIIVVGVTEGNDGTLTPSGLESFCDKAIVYDKLKKFLPPKLISSITVNDFDYTASEYSQLIGRKFQTISIATKIESRPFFSKSGGNGIGKGRVYIRRDGKNEEADNDDIERMIEQKIAAIQTNPIFDLDTDLKELRTLYDNVPKTLHTDNTNMFAKTTGSFLALALLGRLEEPNPLYPKEDYDEFIVRMIQVKKKKIEQLM